jgi:tripartite motif-containing protein 71
LTYQDTTCAGGTTYYYKVRVYLGSYYDYSDLSDYDSGYKKNYGFITGWGSTGTGDGEFDWPWGVAVDTEGNIYVADGNNNRIQKFDSSGTFLGWWGRDDLGGTGWHAPSSGRTGVSGAGDGEFDSPFGVAVDFNGKVYVTEYWNHRVQKFQ